MGDDQILMEDGNGNATYDNASRNALLSAWQNDTKTERAVKLALADDLCRKPERTTTRAAAGQTMSRHWKSLTETRPFPGVVKLLQHDHHLKLDNRNGELVVTLHLPIISEVVTAGTPQKVSARRNSRSRQEEPLQSGTAKRWRHQCLDSGNVEPGSLVEFLQCGDHTALLEGVPQQEAAAGHQLIIWHPEACASLEAPTLSTRLPALAPYHSSSPVDRLQFTIRTQTDPDRFSLEPPSSSRPARTWMHPTHQPLLPPFSNRDHNLGITGLGPGSEANEMPAAGPFIIPGIVPQPLPTPSVSQPWDTNQAANFQDAALAPITPPSMGVNHQHRLLHYQPLHATITFTEQHIAQYALTPMPGSSPTQTPPNAIHAATTAAGSHHSQFTAAPGVHSTLKAAHIPTSSSAAAHAATHQTQHATPQASSQGAALTDALPTGLPLSQYGVVAGLSASGRQTPHAAPADADAADALLHQFALMLDAPPAQTAAQQPTCIAQPVAAVVPPADPDALSMAQLLPPMVRQQLLAILSAPDHSSRRLKEVTVDRGRPVRLRFISGKPQELPPADMDDALAAISQVVGMTFLPGQPRDPFVRSDNRLTLPNSLHRISAQRSSSGRVDGITYRVGRHIPGAARMAADLLASLSGSSSEDPPGSLLLIGRPGVGKTTLLRDVCRVLADDMQRAVHIVDTSNEIAGDGEAPHECIGGARRMSVPERGCQAELMLQVVTNHGPEVVVVDEIGGRDEVAAVRTIAQRGVMLVASAHGTTLQDLLRNPDLNPLLGGIQAVVLGDAAARRGREVERKTRSERKGAPAFAAAIEVLGHGRWRVHHDLCASVDAMLMGQLPDTQLREYATDGTMRVTFETLGAAIRAGVVEGRGGLRSAGGGALEAGVVGPGVPWALPILPLTTGDRHVGWGGDGGRRGYGEEGAEGLRQENRSGGVEGAGRERAGRPHMDQQAQARSRERSPGRGRGRDVDARDFDSWRDRRVGHGQRRDRSPGGRRDRSPGGRRDRSPGGRRESSPGERGGRSPGRRGHKRDRSREPAPVFLGHHAEQRHRHDGSCPRAEHDRGQEHLQHDRGSRPRAEHDRVQKHPEHSHGSQPRVEHDRVQKHLEHSGVSQPRVEHGSGDKRPGSRERPGRDPAVRRLDQGDAIGPAELEEGEVPAVPASHVPVTPSPAGKSRGARRRAAARSPQPGVLGAPQTGTQLGNGQQPGAPQANEQLGSSQQPGAPDSTEQVEGSEQPGAPHTIEQLVGGRPYPTRQRKLVHPAGSQLPGAPRMTSEPDQPQTHKPLHQLYLGDHAQVPPPLPAVNAASARHAVGQESQPTVPPAGASAHDAARSDPALRRSGPDAATKHQLPARRQSVRKAAKAGMAQVKEEQEEPEGCAPGVTHGALTKLIRPRNSPAVATANVVTRRATRQAIAAAGLSAVKQAEEPEGSAPGSTLRITRASLQKKAR